MLISSRSASPSMHMPARVRIPARSPHIAGEKGFEFERVVTGKDRCKLVHAPWHSARVQSGSFTSLPTLGTCYPSSNAPPRLCARRHESNRRSIEKCMRRQFSRPSSSVAGRYTCPRRPMPQPALGPVSG